VCVTVNQPNSKSNSDPLVPKLGVNFPDWAMGPYDLGNVLLFSTESVLTTTYFIEIKLAWEKQAQLSN